MQMQKPHQSFQSNLIQVWLDTHVRCTCVLIQTEDSFHLLYLLWPVVCLLSNLTTTAFFAASSFSLTLRNANGVLILINEHW